MKIVVLDSNVSLSEFICQVLTSVGLDTLPFHTWREMFHSLRYENIDMVIMNHQASGMSPKEVISWCREKLVCNLPILLVTNCSGEEEIIEALAEGANDFIITPLRRRELIARVKVLLHRAYPEQFPAEKLQFGRYLFEIHTARIFLSSQLIELTRKEFALALLLFRNLDKPLSRITMIDAIWSNELDVPSRTLDTHISRIRTKLRLRPENGFRLATVYSYGYRLEQIGLLHEEPQE